jgi:RimJ/RimL family protein N-acetyltransferase
VPLCSAVAGEGYDLYSRKSAVFRCRLYFIYGFDTLGLRRVIEIADTENNASIRVLENVGFHFEKFTTYRGNEDAWYAVCVALVVFEWLQGAFMGL